MKLQSSITMIPIHRKIERSYRKVQRSSISYPDYYGWSNKNLISSKILRNVHKKLPNYYISCHVSTANSRSDNLLISLLTSSSTNIIIGRIIIIINCWFIFHTIYLVNRRYLVVTSACKISRELKVNVLRCIYNQVTISLSVFHTPDIRKNKVSLFVWHV